MIFVIICLFCLSGFRPMSEPSSRFNQRNNENSREKESIHRSIDSYFNQEYHFQYGSLFQHALTCAWTNKSIVQLYEMAGASAEPPLSTTAQNAHDGVDIINLQFVKSALTSHTDASNANLVVSLKSALRKAEWSENDIRDALDSYDPSITVSDYYSQMDNLAVIKSKGVSECVRECVCVRACVRACVCVCVRV